MSIEAYAFVDALASQLRNYTLLGIKLGAQEREWQIAAEKVIKDTHKKASLHALFQAIQHGSEGHRDWLWAAMEAWDRGDPIPEPVG